LIGELEHLKIKTRLIDIDEMFASVMVTSVYIQRILRNLHVSHTLGWSWNWNT
jgi:hypothetical protein